MTPGQTSLPHLLDKGIYLEDSDILLDWGSSRGVLLQLGAPLEFHALAFSALKTTGYTADPWSVLTGGATQRK